MAAQTNSGSKKSPILTEQDENAVPTRVLRMTIERAQTKITKQPQEERIQTIEGPAENSKKESEQQQKQQQQNQQEEQEEEYIPSLVNSFYPGIFTLLIPLCAGLVGLIDSRNLVNGSLPQFTQILFILMLTFSSINIIYLIICWIFIKLKYTYAIPQQHKKRILIPWVICWISYIVIFGLSFKDQSYIYTECDYQQIWDNSAINAVSSAANILCSNSCPCYLKSQTLYSQLTLQLILGNISTSGNAAINISGCSSSLTKDELYYQLKQVESSWNCSGICTRSPLYYFTDINRGPPSEKRACLQVAVEDYLPLIMKIIKYTIVFVIITQFAIMMNFLFSQSDSSTIPSKDLITGTCRTVDDHNSRNSVIQEEEKPDESSEYSSRSGEGSIEFFQFKKNYNNKQPILAFETIQLSHHQRLSKAMNKESQIYRKSIFTDQKNVQQRNSIAQQFQQQQQQSSINEGNELNQSKELSPPTQGQFLEALKRIRNSFGNSPQVQLVQDQK